MPLCEIRIPTYRRPDLLRRALSSVAAQTEQDVRCIIFDDSPDREAEAVVAEFPQLEIDYHPNLKNLGICRNLGKCYQTRAIRSAEFAFCLEDDNAIEPTFVAENIGLLKRSGVNIVVRDQKIMLTNNQIAVNVSTLRAAFKEGVHPAPVALFSQFLYGGFPNGSLFWSTSARSELAIGMDFSDPVLQEYARPFSFREPWAFSSKPLYIFNHASTSYRKHKSTIREKMVNYRRALIAAQIRHKSSEILKRTGFWEKASEFLAPHVLGQVEISAATAGTPVSIRRMWRWQLMRRFLYGTLAITAKKPMLCPSIERLILSNGHEHCGHFSGKLPASRQ